MEVEVEVEVEVEGVMGQKYSFIPGLGGRPPTSAERRLQSKAASST